MVDVALNETEHDALRHVLDRTIRDLGHEISNTDNSWFRDQLRRKRDVLRGLLDRIGGPYPVE